MSATLSDVLVARSRRARRCCECRCDIPIGSGYRRETGLSERGIYSDAMCLDCAAVRELYCKDGYLRGRLWYAVRDVIFENGGRILCDGVAALPRGAKNRLFAEVERYWEDERGSAGNDRP